jgi:hypothetical protein
MIVLPPKYTKHSEYLGVVIYKRKPNTGTHGGMWLADNTTYLTLASAKRAIEFYHLHK